MYRAIWSAADWRVLKKYFHDAGGRETGAFLLLRLGKSVDGGRLLVAKTILPPQGGLEVQGPDALRPSGQWLSSVIGAAIQENCGLAFIHTHPNPFHPPSLSPIDWETSIEWSKSLTPMLDGPFGSFVWSPKGITGVVFTANDPAKPNTVDRVEALGDGVVEILHPADSTLGHERALDDRQIRALTELGNSRLRHLSVGLIGAGGTGSPLAEQLVRMGVAKLVLVDPDVLDESNLRRVVGSNSRALGKRKAEIVGKHLQALGLSTSVTMLIDDVRHESVVRELLSCDIVINTTDTQSSRAFINQIAYQYWIPTIDVGLRIGTSKLGEVSGMPVEVRTLLPDNGCLWCRHGVLNSQTIYEENLPAVERSKLVKEGYIQGLEQVQPSIAPLNFLASALGALTLLRLYSGNPVPAASVIFDGWEQFIHPVSAEINKDCICSKWRGRADRAPVGFLPTIS